ncbi:MAG: hypothetical protein AB7T07_15510 [Steroidobacteraceae bacterium]
MATCFVIQPFDSGKFDKRYDDIYKDAIEAAGLTPYRVDKDPGVAVPIDSIESGIRSAAIVLADITADNPNVWYELGFAFASGKQVVMVCSEERTGKKYPFDIQHRLIIPYLADAPSDFVRLKGQITERVKALLERGEVLQALAESDVAPVHGLSHAEVVTLAVLAGSMHMPDGSVASGYAARDADKAGLTKVGFNLAVRRLTGKAYVELVEESDEEGGWYTALKVTDAGWSWIEKNEDRFVLHRSDARKEKDEIRF